MDRPVAGSGDDRIVGGRANCVTGQLRSLTPMLRWDDLATCTGYAKFFELCGKQTTGMPAPSGIMNYAEMTAHSD